MAGLWARIRRYWLDTVESFPVDHEKRGLSRSGQHQPTSYARVIESPVAAIEEGRGGGSACAGLVQNPRTAINRPTAAVFFISLFPPTFPNSFSPQASNYAMSRHCA